MGVSRFKLIRKRDNKVILNQNFLLPYGSFKSNIETIKAVVKDFPFYSLMGVSRHRVRPETVETQLLSTPLWEFH